MNLNNTLIIHVVCELVIIAGLFFWFNKSLTNFAVKLSEQEQKITEMQATIDQLSRIIMAHDQFLQQITGGGMHQQEMQMPQQMQPQQIPQQRVHQPMNVQQQFAERHMAKPERKKKPKKKRTVVDFNDMLSEELEDIQQSRMPESIVIEEDGGEECTGDFCPVDFKKK